MCKKYLSFILLSLIFSCTLNGGFIKELEYEIEASNINYYVEYDASNNIFPNAKTKIEYPNKLFWKKQVEINTNEKQIIKLMIRFKTAGTGKLKIKENICGYKKILEEAYIENTQFGFIIITL